MEQRYMYRGEVVETEELDDVIAIVPSEGHDSEEEIAQFGQPVAFESGSPIAETQQLFHEDGWIFVNPTDLLREAAAAREVPEGLDSVQRVFVDESTGEVLLGLDHLSVQINPQLSEDQAREILAGAGLEILLQLRFAPNLFHVRVPPERDFLRDSIDLSETGEFVFAEPQFLEDIPPRFVPASQDYGEQWHLNNTGANGGVVGADIRAENAWNHNRGENTRVAVIDHGFTIDHVDLSHAVDHTLSGYFEKATNPAFPAGFTQGTAGMPNKLHGTFCAGLAVADADNLEGGCGVANLSGLVAVAVLRGSTNIMKQETLARAVAYAADSAQEGGDGTGADVISVSLGPSTRPWRMSTELRLAIDHAVTNGRGTLGAPIFWAVANDRSDIALDEVCAYQNTIAVGCSDRTDTVGTCAFGAALDFLATGVQVFSTRNDDLFGTDSGTSFAAPVAAGIGALLISEDSGLTWQTVRQVMRDSCDQIGPAASYNAAGHSPDHGFGRVNAEAALALV